MHPAARHALWATVFGAALLAASSIREGDGAAVGQAIVWLPSGVAIAGVWLLGLRYTWVVAAVVAATRVALDYEPLIVIAAAVGSSAEALAGAWVLRALGLRGDFSRLRDAFALFAAATIAPMVSVSASWLSRQVPGAWGDLPFYSGWGGWWRMNALGALVVVPVVTSWLRPGRAARSAHWLEMAGFVGAAVAVLWSVMTLLGPTPVAIMTMFAVLPIALGAALRCGQRCSSVIAAACILFVTWQTTHGDGPFQGVPFEDRHVAAQVFALLMASIPLVLGSLIAEREEGRARLLRSEMARESLLQLLPDLCYRIGPDDTVLDVIAPEGVPLPRPRKALVRRTLAEIAGPELWPRIAPCVAAARDAGRAPPLEYQIDVGGRQHTREARFLRGGDAEVIAIVRDVTEQRRAQQITAWQAEVLERIATGCAEQTIFEALVRGLEGFLAPGRASLLLAHGRTLRHACAPSLPPDYSAHIDGLPIGPEVGCCGAAAHDNRVCIAPDTRTHPNWAPFREIAEQHGLRACWSVPVRATNGAVLGTFAIYYGEPRGPEPFEIEFVERGAMLAGIAIERTRREGLLASISRNVKDGLYRSAPGQGIVYANDAFARAFGYASAEELLTAIGAHDLPGGPHAEDLARFGPDLQMHEEGERVLHRRDGSRFWAMLSRTLVLGLDGAVVACDGALTDITERRHLAEQLRQAQKMEAIGRLAGGIAHDFNNLLTAITGYAESIRDGAREPEAAEDAGEILRASDRAAALTRQLLAFSRRQVLAPEVLDLSAVVAATGGMLRRLIGEHIRFVVDAANEPLPVRVDKSQIEQVLMNLALNARDAMPEGGTLDVSVRGRQIGPDDRERLRGVEPGAYVELAVRDTGVGMDEPTLSHAFEPFFTTKPPGKGTGLGLATVYGITQQSGGVVWIESTKGRGAAVHILLPRVGAPLQSVLTPVVPAQRRAGRRILLVEDEDMVRELASRILTREGHVIAACRDGQEALARPDVCEWDMLVTDIVMPNLGGRELARRLWERVPGLPVLFMSGYASKGPPVAAECSGPVAFLPKPFVANDLLDAVAHLLAAADTASRSTPRG